MVPEVRDLWPEFELFDCCAPELPAAEDILRCPSLGLVTGDGNMPAYRRWHARVIGRSTERWPAPEARSFPGLFFLRDAIDNCQVEITCLYRWGSCLRPDVPAGR